MHITLGTCLINCSGVALLGGEALCNNEDVK